MAIFYYHKHGTPAVIVTQSGIQYYTNKTATISQEYSSVTFESGLGKKLYEDFQGETHALLPNDTQRIREYILNFSESDALFHFCDSTGAYKGYMELGKATGLTKVPYAPHLENTIWNGTSWVNSAATTKTPLEQATEIVNAWKSMIENSGVTYKGNVFDSDQVSMIKIMSLVQVGIAPPTGFWTTKDNHDVPVTADDLRNLYLAIIEWYAYIHGIQRKMKKSFETMTDEQLSEFDPQKEFLKGTYS